MEYPDELIDNPSKDFDYYYNKGSNYEFDFDYNNACNSYLDAYLAALKDKDGRTYLAEDGIYRTIGYVDDPDIQKRFQDYVNSISPTSDGRLPNDNPFVIAQNESSANETPTEVEQISTFNEDDVM